MGRFDQSWNKLRLQHGMQWRAERPALGDYIDEARLAFNFMLILILIVLVYAVGAQRRYVEAAATRIDAERAVADLRAKELEKCMKGEFYITKDNGKPIGPGLGYGKRATVCRPALEIDV